jgi:hypothetical protein
LVEFLDLLIGDVDLISRHLFFDEGGLQDAIYLELDIGILGDSCTSGLSCRHRIEYQVLHSSLDLVDACANSGP